MKNYIVYPEYLTDIKNALTKLSSGKGAFTILGDSITDTWNGFMKSGGGASDGDHGYPQLLHKYVKAKFGDNITFKNLGAGGYTVEASFEHMREYILPEKYNIVGVALGTNDWNLQNDLDSFHSLYKKLLEEMMSSTDSALFLVSLGFFDDWKSERPLREGDYNEVIFKVARELRLPVVDVRSAMTDYMSEQSLTFADITLEDDPVHPNNLGHEIWFNACKQIFDII